MVEFPPGPMGLELEPVIRSSEREIGCRVKDFYFGVDHRGIDPDKLQELVNAGDVVTFIGSQNVQSARFSDILDLLRSLKDAKRVVTFKDMSTSCTWRVPLRGDLSLVLMYPLPHNSLRARDIVWWVTESVWRGFRQSAGSLHAADVDVVGRAGAFPVAAAQQGVAALLPGEAPHLCLAGARASPRREPQPVRDERG